ncbi:MAG: MarR family transcriptional regulator [Azonexus sp.]|jgi:DNA-binding MarR family transcriptional regulator|nr:MarR family transcriptional regulator [Azonexus sp.]
MLRPDSATANAPSDLREPYGEDHEPQRMWLRLVSCYHLMEMGLRKELRAKFETTLPRFDLMSQLYRYPDGLKMKDLSRLLLVTCGNITGLTDRLVEDGMVERRDNPEDRRAYHVILTAKGRKTFEAMAVDHKRWVGSALAGLAKEDQQRLSALLNKLKRHLVSQPLP